MRARAGARLERALRRRLGAGATLAIRIYRNAYPLTLPQGTALAEVDRATRRFVAMMTGRVIDGQRAFDAMGEAEPFSIPPGLTMTDPLRLALRDFRAWRSQFVSEPAAANPAWSSSQLQYAFSVRAEETNDEDTVLSVPRYRNGDLDWHSFSVETSPAGLSSTSTSVFLPTGLTFGGMPNRRWWAFEDSRTDFGALDVTTTDIAKMALMEFALVYADDWFMYPIVVPAGSLTRIKALRVVDSFGKWTEVPRARTEGTSSWDGWEMFTLTRPSVPPGKSVDVLLVPPAVGFREESEPLEIVRFARDEGANKVWGIERTIMNALGSPVAGAGAHRERTDLRREAAGDGGPPSPASGALTNEETALLRFRLATTVPSNWVPFAPARDNVDGTSIRLRRAQMLLSQEEIQPVSAMSLLLGGAGSPAWLNEETVLRNGLSVQLTRQRVRWVDGKTYVWLGRGVKIGHGEASSGQRFDVVDVP